MVSKAHEDSLIETFDLTVYLGMIRCWGQTLNTEQGAHLTNALAVNLRSIFSKDVCRYAKRDEPTIKEDTSCVRDCCFES